MCFLAFRMLVIAWLDDAHVIVLESIALGFLWMALDIYMSIRVYMMLWACNACQWMDSTYMSIPVCKLAMLVYGLLD
jgi:hypothetical protein